MFSYRLNEESELRLLEPRHAEEVFALVEASRTHLREWLPWVDSTKERKDSEAFIKATMAQFGENNGFQAGIWYKGELAGVVGLHSIDWQNRSTSIGYWLGEEFQGLGLMTMACQAVIRHCFQELELQRIEIQAAVENKKSQAVPERLGFQREGCLRNSELLYGRYVDHYVYGLIRSDYASL